MRITPELSNRIKTRIDAKFENELDQARNEIKDLKGRIKQRVALEIQGLMFDNPLLHSFILNQSYQKNEDSLELIASKVFNYDTVPYELPLYEKLVAVQTRYEELERQKKRENEDFRIMVSYSKDLKELRSLFAEKGFEF